MKLFKRTAVSKDSPIVSVYDSKFHFNPSFSKLAELNSYNFVRYFTDEIEREIGFEFSKEKEFDSFSIFNSESKKYNFRSGAGEIINRYKWVKKVQESQNPEGRNFVPLKRKKLWVIQLMPSFENEVLIKNSKQIHPSFEGIYRYKTVARACIILQYFVSFYHGISTATYISR